MHWLISGLLTSEISNLSLASVAGQAANGNDLLKRFGFSNKNKASLIIGLKTVFGGCVKNGTNQSAKSDPRPRYSLTNEISKF